MNAKREEMKQSIHLLNSRCEGSLPPGPNRYSSCGLSARSQAESAFSDKNAVCGSIVEYVGAWSCEADSVMRIVRESHKSWHKTHNL